MTNYIYMPNLVQISPSVTDVLECLEINGSRFRPARAYMQKCCTTYEDQLETSYFDRQI